MPVTCEPLGCFVVISDFGPAGGPESGVLSNRSFLVRQGFTDDPAGPSVLVVVERRRTRKQARTATSATDIPS
jgi:hypothetical protein